MEEYFDIKINDHIDVFNKLLSDDNLKDEIKKATDIVMQSIKSGGALYLCGNGGSAADAQHIATEFVSRFYKERKALNAEALTTNTSSITAIGNDYGFDRVFVRQLEAKCRKGDVLIGISTSGISKNVSEAIRYAAFKGMHTILLTGCRDNDYERAIYESIIKIPSEDTPRIQEAHIFIGHMMAEYVEREIIKGR